MRLVPCIVLMLSVGLTGCQSVFGKRSTDARGASVPAAPNRSPARFPGSDPLFGKEPEREQVGGLLAGYVVDEYNNRPENTYIRWVCVDDPQDAQAPIDVAVNPQGYFTIRGLKPDSNYKLIARSKQGEKVVAGITYTRTPNIHVMIRMSEGLASNDIPDVPGAPALAAEQPAPPPGKQHELAENNEIPASVKVEDWGAAPANPNRPPPAPNLSIPPMRTDSVKAPQTLSIPDSPKSALGESPGWMPGVAKKHSPWPTAAPRPADNQEIAPVTIRIERPLPIDGDDYDAPPIRSSTLAPIIPPPPPPPAPMAEERPRTQTVVPSCVLLGRKLANFALYDLNQQPWEYRTQRRGKLVLLDFWGPQCVPCIESVPYLRKLHADHGRAGLEVIGIAYDYSPSTEGQIQRIRQMTQKLQMHYLQLLGGGSQCPLYRQFNVQGIPTLVLLDENGWIIWRHTGMLDNYRHQELELLIRKRLEMR